MSNEIRTARTLFRPESTAWRVNREAVLLLGGRRALLMQIAHPLVAAGVADHSSFKTDPLGRLRRTVETMLSLTFGTHEEAQRAHQRIDAVHARVRGRLTQAAGGFAGGEAYDARDPALLFWVHATLVDTALLVYRLCVGRLSAGEEDRYYEETKTIAFLFGISDSLVPASLREFRRYMREMIECGPVRVGTTARELARSILYPPIPLVPSLAFDAVNLVTIGLLPPALRDQYGLEWSPVRQLLLDGWCVGIRALTALAPDFIRVVPPARDAERAFARQRLRDAGSTAPA